MKWTLRPREIQEQVFHKEFEASQVPELTVLSYGAGQDSTLILYLLGTDPEFRQLFAPNKLIVVFSDTGAEHIETYSRTLPQAKGFCEKQRIPFFHLEAGSPYHSKAWPGLLEYYHRTETCGSRSFPKSCTSQLKIRPIYRFLECYLESNYGIPGGRKQGFYRYANKYGKLRMLIGLSAEETGRCRVSSQPLWMRRTVEMRYPLQETSITRHKAQEITLDLGFEIPCPSSCRCCPFLTHRDLLWKYRTRHPEYEELLFLENRKRLKWKHLGPRNYGVFGAQTLPEALKVAEMNFGHLTNQELTMARMKDGHSVKSQY